MPNLCSCSQKSCQKWHPIIEKAIRSEIIAATKRGTTYTVNMSVLAKHCGISRPTLYQHELFIEHLRRSLEIDRQRAEGHAQVQAFKEQVALRDAKISNLEEQLTALHLGISQLYSTLYLNGISADMIIEDVKLATCCDLNACPMKVRHQGRLSDNIVELDQQIQKDD